MNPQPRPSAADPSHSSGARPVAAAPFVKWAGGKRALLPEIAGLFPAYVPTYWEPFAGGGAVFFAMADRIGQAVLSDLNEELVLAYKVVQSDAEALIEALRDHERNHHADGGYYLKVRAQEPGDALGIAARFIYLNKTCFNGLYRVNKSGRFNVPKGDYKNPDICAADKLRAASRALQKATIRFGDFERVCQPSAGDLVYCDPPYDGCFTGYQPGGFDEDAQARLRNFASRCASAGARVVLSNSDTTLIRKLYLSGKTSWTLHETEAPRTINCRAEARTPAPELLIASHAE